MIPSHDDEVASIVTSLGENPFEDRRILVTGGAGFLGSWVCDALVRAGADVTCVDNFASGQEANVRHLAAQEHFSLVRHDISLPLAMDRPVDMVFHMASRASPFEFAHYPIQILKANTMGVMVALGIAKKFGATILYTSTSEVYGDPAIVPTPETYHGNVNPVGPRGCYDEAKRCGEAYVIAYRRQHHLDTRIARIFNTYGPRIRVDGVYGRVVPRFISQALRGDPITIFGDGSQTRSFTYVTDQVEGLLRLASVEAASGEVVNIGSTDEITVSTLAERIIDLTGSRSPLHYSPLPPDDPRRRRPDTQKALTLLGWSPRTLLDDGLLRTIAWITSGNGAAV